MILYRIQSKRDQLGPFSSVTEYLANIGVHVSPQGMDLDDDVLDVVESGQYFYFFTSFQNMCDTMRICWPQRGIDSGWCQWYHDWEVVCVDTDRLVKGADYCLLGHSQAIVHHRLVETLDICKPIKYEPCDVNGDVL